jgi:hypothetical protein
MIQSFFEPCYGFSSTLTTADKQPLMLLPVLMNQPNNTPNANMMNRRVASGISVIQTETRAGPHNITHAEQPPWHKRPS